MRNIVKSKRGTNDWYIEIDKNQKAIQAHIFNELNEKYGHELKYLFQFGDGLGGAFINSFREYFGLNENPEPSKNKKKKIPANIREDVFVKNDYKCVMCGSNRKLTVDHIHPESLGGELKLTNLQTLCHSCNAKKGIKLI